MAMDVSTTQTHEKARGVQAILQAKNLGLSWDDSENAGVRERVQLRAKVPAPAKAPAPAKVHPFFSSMFSRLHKAPSHMIVRGINIELLPGEIVCLVGRSGTGKTTILHALSGLMCPREGEVLLHGDPSLELLGHVSYMFQKDLLLRHKSILDNVCLPLEIAHTLDDEVRARASRLFQDFGLEGTQEKYPDQLSGGMRQRAAFLRTYLMGNDCILLDEAFSALDAITRTQIRLWFCSMVSRLNLAVLAVTHDVDEAVLMASRIYVLKQAKDGPWATISAEIASPRMQMSCEPEEFMLSPEFLACKKEVLAAL